MLKWKAPIQYELTPTDINEGINWVTLKLKNIETKTLKELDIQLHSVNPFNLLVYGPGWFVAAQYISELGPLKGSELLFRVDASGSADVYVTIEGRKDGDYFWWESSWMTLQLIGEKARITSLLVLSNPYTAVGKTILAEATVEGLRKDGGLKLEFWVETPSGKNEKQSTIDIKDLPVGEKTHYKVEATPQEEGLYTIYAYLFDGSKQIDSMTETIYAQKT